MTLVKCVIGACVLSLAAAAAGDLFSESESGPGNASTYTANGYPPTVDMTRFQNAFPH